MYPGTHARTRPDHPAVVMAGSGETVTYGELDARSNQLAHHWRGLGLGRGDHVAVLLENHVRYLEVVWAALRSGLYVTPVNAHLTAPEVAFIVADSGARSLVVSPATLPLAGAVTSDRVEVLRIGSTYEAALAAQPPSPVADESPGWGMLYSSGTTGRPKGVVTPLPEGDLDAWDAGLDDAVATYGYGPDTVYLSPAPTYHAAPLAHLRTVHRLGGTAVVMERFDPAAALRAIEAHRVTHSQWVPTMFVRLLRLPDAERLGPDLSSHRLAIHAAAPCPVEVKRRMIDWWGPILFEYYAGTEGNGMTAITSAEWLERPGSVGRPRGASIEITDDAGRPLPVGEVGTVWFGGGGTFEYRGDAALTAASRREGWSTLGDVGHLDADGYLYLSDRRTDLIISGGVNVYPREIEDVLLTHAAVADVGVVGVADEDLGQVPHAVVQPVAGIPRDGIVDELVAFAAAHLPSFKRPRTFELRDELPRLPTGKLSRRRLYADVAP